MLVCAGAGLADPTGDHGGAVRRRRRVRRRGARVRAVSQPRLGPAGDRRERRRRRRHRRHQPRGKGDARRLRVPVRQRRHPRFYQTLYKKLPYNAATDFAPVALLVEQPMVLLTRKDFPANTLQEFIAYAKANAAKLQYGSAGVGSTTHLSCALLNTAAGLDITHVPYRGGGPVTADLIAGQIHYMCSNSAGAFPQITGNTLKGIALLARSRSPLLPTLATADEQGLAGFEAITWNAFFMPKDTPAAIVKKLNEATIEAMNTPALKDRMHELGVSLVAPERRSPEYLQTFVESEIAKWGAPIKAAGISAD
jgi:tripartite-type tricarboxylate transporter receptor subunit TctC